MSPTLNGGVDRGIPEDSDDNLSSDSAYDPVRLRDDTYDVSDNAIRQCLAGITPQDKDACTPSQS